MPPVIARPAFDDIYMTLAVNLAKRSHCVKKKVGAVLTKDTRIVSIGYNGPPAGTYTLYVTLSPCLPCARIIFSAGIKQVLYKESYAAYKGLSKEEGLDFLQEFGVKVVHHIPKAI